MRDGEPAPARQEDAARRGSRRAGSRSRRAGDRAAQGAAGGRLHQLDQGFADALPYPDASFDRVLSSFMFHHLSRDVKEKTLREARRVLKPGGRFHMVDFAPAGASGKRGFTAHADPRRPSPEGQRRRARPRLSARRRPRRRAAARRPPIAHRQHGVLPGLRPGIHTWHHVRDFLREALLHNLLVHQTLAPTEGPRQQNDGGWISAVNSAPQWVQPRSFGRAQAAGQVQVLCGAPSGSHRREGEGIPFPHHG